MIISKLKAAYALLTGGMAGIIKYFLDVFNDQVLGRISNKESAAKYLHDVQAASIFLRAIMENHDEDLSEERKEAFAAILVAIDELAEALEDFELEQKELDEIIEAVKKAIDAWKKAKSDTHG